MFALGVAAGAFGALLLDSPQGNLTMTLHEWGAGGFGAVIGWTSIS